MISHREIVKWAKILGAVSLAWAAIMLALVLQSGPAGAQTFSLDLPAGSTR